MSEKTVTTSQLMSNLILVYSALNEVLAKLSQSVGSSYNEYTKVNWYNEDGSTTEMNIPSIGYIKTDLNALHDDIENLINNNNDTITLNYKDGSVRSFEMKKVAELLEILDSTKDVSFEIPSAAKTKLNWMFESFLNPLLYMPIDISTFLNKDNDIKKFSVRRVILNSPNTNAISFFENNFKVSTLDYNESVNLLKSNGIPFSIDDTEYELASCINSKRGSFSILNISTIEENVAGSKELATYYTFDKLTYTNVIKNSNGSTMLAIGDVLITSDNTEYKVRSIDKEKRLVKLEKVFGSGYIGVGANVLRIKPDAYRVPELQINIGYNEYEIIFVKPISSQMDLTTDEWTKGFGVYTNDLEITLSDNKTIGLKEYYENYVSDFGVTLLGMAKEKQVPAVIGLEPDAPVLTDANLHVVCINQQVSNTQQTTAFASLIATKNNIRSQIDAIDTKINDKKSEISKDNATVQSTSAAQLEIKNLTKQKSGYINQLTTTLNEITTKINSENNILVKPKYRVRGFVDIPEAKQSEYGKQEIIQMCVSYRYKSPNSSASKNISLNYVNANGDTVSAYFSPWTEVYSKIRRKVYNEETGTYDWDDVDNMIADRPQISYVDIPITRGEQVEVRVKAISEAGYPLNPLESEWSNVLTIDFPEEFETSNESEFLAEQLLIEDALSKFENDLTTMGIDQHLVDSFWTNEKYYAHTLDNIASGFFTAEYKNISAYEYLKTLTDKITNLESVVENAMGTFSIQILTPDNKTIDVTKGSVVTLPIEYYKNKTSEAGGFVEKTYQIIIKNTSATPLEFASIFANNGFDVPAEKVDDGRKYNCVPINIQGNTIQKIGSSKQESSYQSAQMSSQFIYGRYKNYGLKTDLYCDVKQNDVQSDNSSMTDGIRVFPYSDYETSTSTPYILCFNSSKSSDYGKLTNFCISSSNNDKTIDDFKKNAKSWIDNQEKNKDGEQLYLKFSHTFAMHVCKEDGSETVNGTQVMYYQQAPYIGVPSSEAEYTYTKSYPIKMGFQESDKYFVGKYTCGAYLFLGPAAYEEISINGNTASSTKVVSGGQSISIPVVFQYRCQDRKGYVGGYNTNGTTRSNVTYQKQLGVDIYSKLRSNDSDSFSFDIVATAKYSEK